MGQRATLGEGEGAVIHTEHWGSSLAGRCRQRRRPQPARPWPYRAVSPAGQSGCPRAEGPAVAGIRAQAASSPLGCSKGLRRGSSCCWEPLGKFNRAASAVHVSLHPCPLRSREHYLPPRNSQGELAGHHRCRQLRRPLSRGARRTEGRLAALSRVRQNHQV